MTPEDVHYGRAAELQAHRRITLQKAYQRTPERFVNASARTAPFPKALVLPEAVWINPPPRQMTESTPMLQ